MVLNRAPGKEGSLDNLMMSIGTLVVRIGDVNCAVTSRDEAVYQGLEKLYDRFLCHDPADIYIDINAAGPSGCGGLTADVPEHNFLKVGSEVMAVYHASRRPEGEYHVNIEVDQERLDPRRGFKIMYLVMPRAYYTARPAGAMLVHSCGILRRGHILLFIGPSGAGKSTVASLCGDEDGRVVNDEMMAVFATNGHTGRPVAQGLPILGDISCGFNASSPLAAVFLLKHSPHTAVHRLDRLEAFLAFMRQVIASRRFDTNNDTARIIAENIDFSDRISRAVPFFRLEFNLDGAGLWEAIEETEVGL
jgi:hypothetical protein